MDADQDGLPDGVENSVAGLKDPPTVSYPAGRPLPNINAMGANSARKDFFVEFNAMKADPGTTYGPDEDVEGHHHVPTPEVLKMIGDAFKNAPVQNPNNGPPGIRAHFDVGTVGNPQNCPPLQAITLITASKLKSTRAGKYDYASLEADEYLVGNGIGTNVASLAQGGEIIKEVACDPNDPGCQFPDYAGTVGWKFGFQFYRDSPVGNAGEELTTEAQITAWNAGTTKRRRFDVVRKGLFHYVLNAHARAKRTSYPCLVNGHPADYDLNNGTACTLLIRCSMLPSTPCLRARPEWRTCPAATPW